MLHRKSGSGSTFSSLRRSDNKDAMIRLHIRAPGEGGGQQRLRVEVAPDATLLFLSCTLAARHLAACPPAGFRLSLNRRDAIGAFPPPPERG